MGAYDRLTVMKQRKLKHCDINFFPTLKHKTGPELYAQRGVKEPNIFQTIFILWKIFNPASSQCSPVQGSFLEGPEKFFHPKSCSKISNLMTTELFYLRIFNRKRGSLHTYRQTYFIYFNSVKSSVNYYNRIKNEVQL